MEWAIGKGYDLFAPGTGKLIMPGEKLSWDQHLHAVGRRDNVGSEIALWLYPKGQEPKKRSYLIGFTGLKKRGFLDIAPNTMAYTEGFTVLKENTMITNFQPHFHLRGKAMEVKAILPDGSTQVVSYVGNFNFNWMTNYIYADDAAPVFPKGTVIQVSAWYDNTKNNPNNPDPDQWVGYGDRTVDEMAHAWMNVVYLTDDEYKALARREEGARDRREPAAVACVRVIVALTLVTGVWASSARPTISEPLRGFGASVTPAYEGWFTNADGTHSFLIGYLNRNNTQSVDIPIGPATASSRAVPTSASPRISCPAVNRHVPDHGAEGIRQDAAADLDDHRQRPDQHHSVLDERPLRSQPVHRHRRRQQAAGDSVRSGGPGHPGADRPDGESDRAHRDGVGRHSRCRSGRPTMRSIRADRMRRSAIRRRR